MSRELVAAAPARRVTGELVKVGARKRADTVEVVSLEYRTQLEENLRAEALLLMECHPRLVRTLHLAMVVVYRRAGFEWRG